MGEANRLVIAGMATMPSRVENLERVLKTIVPQVDRLYLYLDGFKRKLVTKHPKLVVTPSNREPGLHADGKFLHLDELPDDALFLGFDDDILYPPDYVARLRDCLESHQGEAIVGLHGIRLESPFKSYSESRETFHFKDALGEPTPVDILGTGTVMFEVGRLRFDVRGWQHHNMADLCFALESEKGGLPRVAVSRSENWLEPMHEKQEDSLYRRMLKDDAPQTRLAKELLSLMGRN